MFGHLRITTWAAVIALSVPAFAQEDRPTPEAPAQGPLRLAANKGPDAVRVLGGSANGRRASTGERVSLGLNQVSVEDLIPFIVETTGKAVVPSSTTAITALMQRKITVIRDEPVDRMEALDLIFNALRLNGVGIVEHDDRIVLVLHTELPSIPPPVLGPDDPVLGRRDLGIQINKIYRILNTDAEAISEHIQSAVPDDTTVTVDANSNSIMVQATIEVCQHVQRLINALDHRFVKVKTETFRLAHADATEIANNIMELFEETDTTRRSATPVRTPQTRLTADQRRRMREATQRSGRSVTPSAAEVTPGPFVELRVTVNTSQNSVTVQGNPAVIELISQLIHTEWDLPRPKTTKRVYFLQYTDPLKMRDMLHELLGQGGAGIGTGRRTAGGAGGQAGRGDVSQAIGGIYRIEAYPDSNSLVVISKTEEAFDFLDSLISDLDQPIFPGLPMVVELKHADAEEVADQVNVILAPPGARVDMQRRQQGLQGIDIGGPTGDSATATGQTGTGQQQAGAGGSMSFPWQQSRGGEEAALESALIGKVRVVPIHRQNAVMILAAPEYRESVRDLITNELDKPGRQVMISAILAEVEWTDEFAFGWRFSNSDSILGGPLVDNRIGGNIGFNGTNSAFLDGLFDTSILNLNVDLVAVLAALSQKTKVRILQQPAVFTADNQEASFFEGQDVPIQLGTSTSPEGTLVNEQIDYRSVGIGLNVRPRITAEGDVDMEINLEVSNIVPGQLQFSSPVFDRRETTTQIIVKNGQTIVISGILRDLESVVERGVPLLKDIPLLGELFKSRENTTTTTELLMFIQPIVVDNPTENNTNFNRDARNRLDQLRQPLKEQEKNRPPERRELFKPQDRPQATPAPWTYRDERDPM